MASVKSCFVWIHSFCTDLFYLFFFLFIRKLWKQKIKCTKRSEEGKGKSRKRFPAFVQWKYQKNCSQVPFRLSIQMINRVCGSVSAFNLPFVSLCIAACTHFLRQIILQRHAHANFTDVLQNFLLRPCFILSLIFTTYFDALWECFKPCASCRLPLLPFCE